VERNGYDNLLVMCVPHNRIVDDKRTRHLYPVEVLQEYKQNHEAQFHGSVIDNAALDAFVDTFIVAGSVITTHNQSGGQNANTITNIYTRSYPPVVQPTRVIISALHQLPPPPSDFTGRDADITELINKIERGGVTISGLQGLGGIGKTALALKLAQQLTTHYPDAQFYLDLRGASKQPLSAIDALSHVVRSYHPTATLPDKEAELQGLYRSVLHDQCALLLMDNALDAEQVAPLIPPVGCVLLVTSRQHFTLPGLYSKNLGTLPPDEACKLLVRIAPRIGEQASAIAKLCGYLPLALRLAASATNQRVDLSVTEYVRRLTDTKQRLQLVEASLSLSYDLLNINLQRQWRALAVFPDTFDVEAAAALWQIEPDATLDSLGELLRFSLLDWDETISRYSMHDLARLFADSRLSNGERNMAQRLHSRHYVGVIQKANTLYKEGGEAVTSGLLLFDSESLNIEAGQSWAQSNSKEDAEALRLCSAYPNAAPSLLDMRFHPRERARWFEAGFTSAQRLGDRAAECWHLINLGRAYYFLDGLPERPTKMYERALDIAREIGERDGEGQALGNLGVIYRELGKTSRAIEIFEQRLEIARELNDKRGEGNTLGNLGRAYWTLGEPLKTIEFCKQQLEIAREIGDRSNEARALGNLGQAHLVLREQPLAIEFFEQSLNIQKELGNLRGQGGALGDMGRAYEGLRDYQRAIECYEQSLFIQREAGYRRAQGYALANLGRAYYRLGDLAQAIDYHQQHLLIARETNDLVAEGLALFNIGCALYKLDNHNHAIEQAEASLKIFEQIEDPHAEKVRNKLAQWRKKP
jgi:tetratricopeptide (TPR) repeat protein